MNISGISDIALRLLKGSSESPVLYISQIVSNREQAERIIRKLRKHGITLSPTLDGELQVTVETRIKLALLALRGAATVYEISRYLDWREFETLAARIFEENDHMVFQNYRFTLKNQRNEIDLVAIKAPLAIVADAKHYSASGRGSIKQAVAAQKRRAERLAQHISEGLKCRFSEEGINEILPIIITWLEEHMRIHDCC
ncbi:MAG: NERD domain-containing protein, partial [Candidatus Hodarchaeota archaeon]